MFFFDIVPDSITAVLTILFPIFASYKALRTSNPAHLAPWLMYWIVLSLVNLAESWLWIITWFPFYAWFRLFGHLYLLMPGSQLGATFLYTEYIEPFLAQHEASIEKFITDTHDRLKAAGLGHVENAIELFKQKVLGIPPARQEPPPTAAGQQGYGSYAQALFSRFDLPSVAAARPVAGDLYGLVSQALAGAARGAGPTNAAAISLEGRDIVPPEVRGREERQSYIRQSRETLEGLLKAFDRESADMAADVDDTYEQGRSSGVRRRHGDGIGRNRSELDFDTIDRDEVVGRLPSGDRRAASGGWLPRGWGGGAPPPSLAPARGSGALPYPESDEEGEKRGYERRRRRSHDRARARDNDLAY